MAYATQRLAWQAAITIIVAPIALFVSGIAEARDGASLASRRHFEQLTAAGLAALRRDDTATAVRNFTIACNGGIAPACSNLGTCYEQGIGVVQSYDRAIAYYRRALAIDPNNSNYSDNIRITERHRAAKR